MMRYVSSFNKILIKYFNSYQFFSFRIRKKTELRLTHFSAMLMILVQMKKKPKRNRILKQTAVHVAPGLRHVHAHEARPRPDLDPDLGPAQALVVRAVSPLNVDRKKTRKKKNQNPYQKPGLTLKYPESSLTWVKIFTL